MRLNNKWIAASDNGNYCIIDYYLQVFSTHAQTLLFKTALEQKKCFKRIYATPVN